MGKPKPKDWNGQFFCADCKEFYDDWTLEMVTGECVYCRALTLHKFCEDYSAAKNSNVDAQILRSFECAIRILILESEISEDDYLSYFV